MREKERGRERGKREREGKCEKEVGGEREKFKK
jgi:hypothetical protein